MLRIPSKAQLSLRLIAIAMSAGFFFYLIWRAGPSKLWKSLSELSWGIILVIALAGVSHLARTWGWRLALGNVEPANPRLFAPCPLPTTTLSWSL